MVITINGRPGSGKSTVARRLAEHLGVPRFYAGDAFRKMARERGLTAVEFNKVGEVEPEIDRLTDELVVKFANEHSDCVIESRTGFHLIPASLKIFLDVTPEEGSRRIFSSLKKGDDRNEDHDLTTPEKVLASVKTRIASEAIRYQKYNGVNIFDPSHYDLFLDTTDLTTDQVFDRVTQFVAQRQKNA